MSCSRTKEKKGIKYGHLHTPTPNSMRSFLHSTGGLKQLSFHNVYVDIEESIKYIMYIKCAQEFTKELEIILETKIGNTFKTGLMYCANVYMDAHANV